MEEESTVLTGNGSDPIEAGATPVVNTAPSPTESNVDFATLNWPISMV